MRFHYFISFCFISMTSFVMAQSTTLKDSVIELPLANSNKVVIKLMFQNGSISDPAGKEGITQATANLIIQGGTGDMSFSEIQDFIYPMAASYNVLVDKEVTIFSFQVHQDFLNEFYPIISGLMLSPGFDDNDYQRLITSQQNYVDQVIRASSDEDYSKKALEDLLFRNTNYQHMKQGTSDSVKNIRLEDIQDHYQNVFTRNNLTIGIAGNYSKEFLELLINDMAQLSSAQALIPDPAEGNQPEGIQVEIIAKPGAFGSAIFTGFPLDITRSSDDFAALMVANSYLGEHRKAYSRLYQKIREERSMNYGDYTYIEWYENGGANMLPRSGVPRRSNYFSIWIRPVQIASELRQQYAELSDITVGHGHFALRMAIRELDILIEEGLSEEDFEATRTFLRSYTKLYAQTPASRLGYLMDSSYYGREDYLFELDGLLANLTLDEVNAAIRKYWQTDNMFVTIITDVSEAGPLAASLMDNTPSPMTYSDLVRAGLGEEILSEDDSVADYPLNVQSVVIIDSADTFQ